MALPDPERTRRHIGLALYVLGIVIGGVLLFVLFLIPPIFSPEPLKTYAAMILGIVLAIPAGLMYLTVPRLLDRYDPEPWYALVGCLLWGGLAACGFSAAINSLASAVGAGLGGARAGQFVSAVISAPLVEEFWKGVGVLGVFFFLRREFDGVVDGIIYATFTALGFATIENIVYYSQAAMHGEGVLAMTFLVRGVLGPWGHPLYTSMLGIGIGVSRESTSAAVRWLAPLAGYLGAVFLHALWNGSSVLASGGPGALLFLLSLPLWLLFVTTFLIIVIALVRRRGRIIREHLEDEVALGHLSSQELELTASAFGLMRARMRYGPVGVQFVRAAARLALSKWHTRRAKDAAKSTVSAEFIAPLRQRIARLRGELS